MAILATILGLVLLLIIYFFISKKIRTEKLSNEINKVCLTHEKLKYPELDKITQMKIMETGDLSSIAKLVPEYKDKVTPTKLLEKYITITKAEFSDYLIQSVYIEKQKIENANNPEQDGIWIIEDKIVDQERGQIHRSWKISNMNEASDIYGNLLWKRLYAYEQL